MKSEVRDMLTVIVFFKMRSFTVNKQYTSTSNLLGVTTSPNGKICSIMALIASSSNSLDPEVLNHKVDPKQSKFYCMLLLYGVVPSRQLPPLQSDQGLPNMPLLIACGGMFYHYTSSCRRRKAVGDTCTAVTPCEFCAVLA
jgi:hypothetical protein